MLLQVANRLDKITRPISTWVNGIGAFILLGMVMITVVDVLMRGAVNKPLLGIIDLQQFLLLVLIFFGIAFCQFEGRHIKVTIFTARFPESLRHIIDSGTYILGIFIFSVIVWRSIVYGQLIWTQGAKGATLDIPAAPFVFVITFGSALLVPALFSAFLRSVNEVWTNNRKLWPLLIISVAISALLITIPVWLHWEVGTFIVGLAGLALLLFLMLIGTPIAFAMSFVGFIGMAYLKGFSPILQIMGSTYYVNLGYHLFITIPFFLLMGSFLAHTGVGREIYNTAYAWIGSFRGGLSQATVLACGGFAAICGDSIATAMTMGRIALPEMKRFRYDDGLATGCVAGGGTLGILIPPSLGFIFYAIITEESIGRLFIAGIIPGILLIGLYMLNIYIRCRLNVDLGPPGPRINFKEKLLSLRHTWVIISIFLLVVGGLYIGIFTPTEAGAIGAFAALIIGLVRGKFNRSVMTKSLLESGTMSAMLLIILGGVYIMGYLFATSRITLIASEFVASLHVSRYVILMLILLIYFVLGMLMNIGPMILLTLPILYPTVMALGFDSIWFGVMMVIMMEMGLITPPVGMCVYAISGIARDVPMGTIFKGIFPFVISQALLIVILILFPQIATWLPSLMWN